MANEKKMDYVILGLLSHEPMTGYEIKKRIDTTLSFFWGASYGSIYPTLNGLVRDEKITKFETTDNSRNKIIYTITDAGRAYLKEWLKLPAEKDEHRYEILLKLFFGNQIGAQITAQHIQGFEEKAKKGLSYLEAAVNELSQIQDSEPAHNYYLLTAMFGVKVYQAYVEWCGEAQAMLSNEEGK